jgi:hypothetical protein
MKNTRVSSKPPEHTKSKKEGAKNSYSGYIALLVIFLGVALYLTPTSPSPEPNLKSSPQSPGADVDSYKASEDHGRKLVNVFEKDPVLIDFSQLLQVCFYISS